MNKIEIFKPLNNWSRKSSEFAELTSKYVTKLVWNSSIVNSSMTTFECWMNYYTLIEFCDIWWKLGLFELFIRALFLLNLAMFIPYIVSNMVLQDRSIWQRLLVAQMIAFLLYSGRLTQFNVARRKVFIEVWRWCFSLSIYTSYTGCRYKLTLATFSRKGIY
jgi:hypothetical protein